MRAHPSLDSPRFNLRQGNFHDIDAALSEVGHVVLDDLWNEKFLLDVRDAAAKCYSAYDEQLSGDLSGHRDDLVETYLAGNLDFAELRSPDEARFMEDFMRSGLPALYRHLLAGDFVVAQSERVVRRVDPLFSMRFVGLHFDGQLAAAAREGFNSTRELTLWSPLQECTSPDTPRLLLLHKGEHCFELFSASDHATMREVKCLPIQGRPWQIRDPSDAADLATQLDPQFEKVYAARRCYAPLAPFGSAILFEHSVLHGSYYSPQMTRRRMSLDFRAVGKYRVTPENSAFTGSLMTCESFPPILPKKPKSIGEMIRSNFRSLSRR